MPRIEVPRATYVHGENLFGLFADSVHAPHTGAKVNINNKKLHAILKNPTKHNRYGHKLFVNEVAKSVPTHSF